MEACQFSQKIDRLTKQKNLAYLLVLFLSISLIFTSIAVFFKKERVVVIPTVGDSYSLGCFDEAYVEKMGVFLSNLLLNRSPVDIEWRNRMVLKHTDPSFYHDLKKKLEEEAQFLSAHNEQTFIFYPQTAEANAKKLTFCTEGQRVVFVGTSGERSHISQQDIRRYRLEFKKHADQLLLCAIKKESVN